MLMWKVEDMSIDSILLWTVAVDSHSSLVGFVCFPSIESCFVGAIVSPSLVHHSLKMGRQSLLQNSFQCLGSIQSLQERNDCLLQLSKEEWSLYSYPQLS